MVAGFGDQVGYDALVSNLTGGTIDKAHRFSDWSARPLSAAQITYAAADVTHLREVYQSAQPPAGAGKPAGLGRRGDGDPQQPRDLPHRSGHGLGAAAPAHHQPAPAVCAEGRGGMAGEGGAARQHPAPAPDQGRGAAGNRRHRAGQRRCAGAGSRRDARLRRRPLGAALLEVLAAARRVPDARFAPRAAPARRRSSVRGPGVAAEGAAGGEVRTAPCRGPAGRQFR